MDPTLLAHPPGAERSFLAFLESLPDVLAARDLRTTARAVATASREGRGVVLLLGGHVIKVGLGPLVADLVARGIVTHVAMNGAAAIHDFELTAFGGTSEDVAAGLADGTFGMAEETGRDMNAAIGAAARQSHGMGEGLARHLAALQERPGDASSVLLACLRKDVPDHRARRHRRRDHPPAPRRRRRRARRHESSRLRAAWRAPCRRSTRAASS